MTVVLWVIAAIELVVAFAVFVTARSAIHEILGTLMGGFAVLTIALACILAELRKHRMAT